MLFEFRLFFFSFSQIWCSVCIFSRYFCCSQRSYSVVVTFWLFVDLFVWQRFDCAYLGFVSLIVYLFYTIFKFCLFFSACRTTVNCCLFRFHPHLRWIVSFSVNLSVLNRKLSYLSIIYQINEFEGIETGFSALFSNGDNVHAQNSVPHEQALLLGCVRNSTFEIILLFGCSYGLCCELDMGES